MKEIATLTTTKYILDKYNLHALKKYGQNFLIDVNVIKKIVASGQIDEHTAVIEIGPGIGALTQILSSAAGTVKCFEIDERFKPVYDEFLDSNKVEIIFGDFMKQDLCSLVMQLKKTYSRVCVVANLPYYITTAIIEKIALSNCGIDEMIVMVQKEVALKMTSDYKNPLLLLLEDMGKVDYLFTVSKNVFSPAPHVDSAILKISFEKVANLQLYKVLNICFKQRRKTILNNLKGQYPDASRILEQCEIDLKKRSEELTLDDFKAITKVII